MAMMQAIRMRAPGGPEVLELVERSVPELRSEHDIRVRLHAAALNPVDYKIRTNGGYGEADVLGCDGAGAVDAVGSAVTRFKPGDAVYFMNGGYGTAQGTYAQYVVLDERYAARKPTTLDFADAAAVPLVLITAWEALHGHARVREHDVVLVQAGAGGVGHVAVQLAKIAGARVAATVSGEEKAAFVTQLGAERAINYRSEDVGAALSAWSGRDGADVVFDTVGGATFQQSLPLLGVYGRLVSCASRELPSGDGATAFQRNVQIAYTWMPAAQVFGLHDARVCQTQILERGAALIDEGKLRIVVGRRYPLVRAADAQRALERGEVMGKIVLDIS
jgi:NADPH2:quinone reductase